MYSQSATDQHFFGSVVLQSSFPLSCAYQSSVTAEADGLQLDSAFGVTSGVTSQNVEGKTEPSLKVNCFYTDKKQLHLHWLNKSFMLYQRTVHGGLRFSVQGPRATDFFFDNELLVQ